MKKRIFAILMLGIAAIAVGPSSRIAAQDENPAVHHGPAKKDRARIVLAQPLSQLDGSHLKASLVEVHYGPGEASPPHSHPCPVIGYVLEGAIRTKVNGAPEAVYKVGETFYEPANGVHEVSANASATEPARLLAYFVCDHDASLSSPVEDPQSKGGR